MDLLSFPSKELYGYIDVSTVHSGIDCKLHLSPEAGVASPLPRNDNDVTWLDEPRGSNAYVCTFVRRESEGCVRQKDTQRFLAAMMVMVNLGIRCFPDTSY